MHARLNNATVQKCQTNFPHLVVVTQPDLVGHLVDEPEVVAHKHQTTIEALDSVSQGVDGLQVKMVGGLCCTYKQKAKFKVKTLSNGLYKQFSTMADLSFMEAYHAVRTFPATALDS